MIGLISKPVTYGLAAALVAASVWGGWQWRGKVSAQGEAADARAELSAYKADVAEQRELAERQARQQEHRHAADMARIEQETRQRLKEAGNAAYDRAVADVRAGRLRNVWTCPAALRLPEAGGAAADGDGAPDDRGAAVARVLRIGAEADARIRACQAVLISDRARD